MVDRPTIAAFRPPDHRADAAASAIEAVGATPLLDPMIAPESTGAAPRRDAEWTILTSVTAAELPAVSSWTPGSTTVVAIGPKTAGALEAAGISVDRVPETYTSTGLVDELGDAVAGDRVELARSDHGSDALPAGLRDAGAYVHETVLYRLIRPPEAGASVEAVIDGTVDALAFSSTLTVEHFLETAEAAGSREPLEAALESVTIGAIGPPTASRVAAAGLSVDVVASKANFEVLTDELIEAVKARTRSA